MKPIRKRMIFCLLAVSFLFLVNSNWVMAGSQCICPTVTADPQISEGWYLKWDPDNPDLTDQDGSTIINIKGSRPPFTWSVSENGFTLEDSQTWGLSNILYDGTACNTCEVAEITVTDAYEESVTGYVRCQNGTWVYVADGCIITPGECSEIINPCNADGRTYCCVYGKYYQVQHVSYGGSHPEWGLCPGDCCQPHGPVSYCLEGSCDPVYGCDFCLVNGCCKNSGYAGSPCPPVCRRWCRCNLDIYYMEWRCAP
jgi:hypothetical protein